MNKNQLLKNTIVYILLIIGFFLFYVAQFDVFVNHEEGKESSSKVDFVYQQF
jgi:hypothetical protein